MLFSISAIILTLSLYILAVASISLLLFLFLLFYFFPLAAIDLHKENDALTLLQIDGFPLVFYQLKTRFFITFQCTRIVLQKPQKYLLQPDLVKSVIQHQFCRLCAISLSQGITLPNEDAELGFPLLSVNVPQIDAADFSAAILCISPAIHIPFSIRICHTDNKLHHMPWLHLLFQPGFMPLSGKGLLINEVFPHKVLIPPGYDLVRIR